MSDKTFHRYRILAGFHVENGRRVSALPQPDVFESPSNLLDFNSGRSIKFERVHPSTPLTVDVYESGGKHSEGQLSQEEIDKQRENLRLKNQLDEQNKKLERLEKELEQARLNSPQYSTAEDNLPQDNPFEDMNLEQLRKYARENEINLRGKTTKAEIIDILKHDLEVSENPVSDSFDEGSEESEELEEEEPVDAV